METRMKTNVPYDVLVIGNPFYDQATQVPESFLSANNLEKSMSNITTTFLDVEKSWENSKENNTTSQNGWKLGGSGTNVAKTMQRLGTKTALLGKIGKDETGKDITQRLHDIGMTTLLSEGNNGTGRVNCFITPDYERTMHAYLGTASEFSEKDVLPQFFKDIKLVHIEGYASYYGTTIENAVEYATSKNALISLDLASANVVETFLPRFKQILPKIDIIFGNQMEMQQLTGTENIATIFEKFQLHQTVVLTVGKDGCWVKDRGQTHPVHYGATPTDAIDLTGAGDFFAGAFLTGHIKGHTTDKCVAMANTAASAVIKEIGADLSEENWTICREIVDSIQLYPDSLEITLQ